MEVNNKSFSSISLFEVLVLFFFRIFVFKPFVLEVFLNQCCFGAIDYL